MSCDMMIKVFNHFNTNNSNNKNNNNGSTETAFVPGTAAKDGKDNEILLKRAIE
jgi:hypothetical protein